MITEQLLEMSSLLFAAVLVVTLVLWLLRSALETLSERRMRRRRPRAVAAVAAALVASDPATAVTALRALGREEKIAVLAEMAFTVAGEQRRHLDAIARATGVLRYAERWARSRRWGRRLRAARLLALFGGDGEAIGDQLFLDPRAEVRAQAAEWAGAHPSSPRIDRLAGMLADIDPLCRFAAREALTRVGGAARPVLRRCLATGAQAAEDDHRSVMQAMGALEVARGVAYPGFLDSAERLSRSPNPSVRSRAASLAGSIGGAQAATRLVSLLSDGSPEVREQAARALGRLGYWRAAAAVAELLSDRVWAVQVAAAGALRRMGATGELLLRRAARAEESRASEVARRELALVPAPQATAERRAA